MKSRIVFTLIMAAFFNPISVMALDSSKISCDAYATNAAKDAAIKREEALQNQEDNGQPTGHKTKSVGAG